MPVRTQFRIGPFVVSDRPQRRGPAHPMTERRWKWSVFVPAVILIVIFSGLLAVQLAA